MILGDLINYKKGIINIEIELVMIKIEGRTIMMNFNILLLGNNKVVLKML